MFLLIRKVKYNIAFLCLIVTLAFPHMVSAVEVKSFLGLEYLTGGVGMVEEEEIRLKGHSYSLLILVAEKDKFLSAVAITILGSDNSLVLETQTEGPYLYVNLEPGKYQILASGFGESFQRKITISSGKQQKQVFVWPGNN